ncbi:MAG TPA: phosphotransferase, partial [Stellaceae bacterium]|nr:phosphotransferase [Stellaceae bacterium]
MTQRARLGHWLASATEARAAVISALERLPGGAVQENWRLDVDFAGGTLAGRQSLVLRHRAATALGIGLDGAGEFAVLGAVHAAGVPTPEPLLLCRDASVIGTPFLVMRRLPGEATPERIVAGTLGGERGGLIAALAEALAAIHRLAPPRADLAALGAPPADPAA